MYIIGLRVYVLIQVVLSSLSYIILFIYTSCTEIINMFVVPNSCRQSGQGCGQIAHHDHRGQPKRTILLVSLISRFHPFPTRTPKPFPNWYLGPLSCFALSIMC